MTFKEKEKLFKEIEKTKGAIAFELQKLEAAIEGIALKNIEFSKEEGVDITKAPF